MPGPTTQVQNRPKPKAASTVGAARKPAMNGVNKATKNLSATAAAAKRTPPVPQAAAGVSPFEIMASRIANRVAEMAETVTFVERQPPRGPVSEPPEPQSNRRQPPRKLEIRLPNSNVNGVKFSAPFLDNLLAKMLQLQNRMLMTGQDIAASDNTDDKLKREQFEQSAELSRIIALICAEKARQGVV